MVYDQGLETRIRKATAGRRGVTERRMFGGVAFLLEGRMFCGIVKDELMARIGPDQHEDALAKAHVRPMDFTGRPLHGYVFVEAEGCRTQAAVEKWVARAADFVATLPAKRRKRPAR